MLGMMLNSILAAEGFKELPSTTAPAGVYVLLRGDEVLYVGQSINVYQRVAQHYNAKRRGYRKKLAGVTPFDLRIRAIPYDRILIRPCLVAELDRIELGYIHRYKPRFNIDMGTLLPKVKVNLGYLAAKAGIEDWERPSNVSSQNFVKRRRVA